MNANEIQDRAEETAQSLKEKALDWQRAAKENVGQWARNTDDYVHENPWMTIGLAALAAFTFGLLLGSRRD